MDSKTIKELWKQLTDQQLANNFVATKFKVITSCKETEPCLDYLIARANKLTN